MKVSFPGGKRVYAEYKGFVIKTDQPEYAGGEGSDPAPFDLFLASIATCSGLYVLSFCQSRGIPTENCHLLLNTHKDPETKRIDKISISIQLPPDFPEKYETAVIKSVDSCAVKVYILNAPEFEVSASIGK